MPNLQPHVTSLELSLALKEAGWPQEGSMFYWVMAHPYSLVLPGPSWQMMHHGQLVEYKDGEYAFLAAPLATELMERMKNANFVVEPRNHGWVCFHCPRKKNGELTGEQFPFYDQSIPDVLAKLALHLIKEGNMRF